MSLSPYVAPSNLNGSLVSSQKLGGAAFPDGLDKRKSLLFPGQKVTAQSALRNTTEIIDTVADSIDSMLNLAGIRSNLYIIGQVRTLKDSDNNDVSVSEYMNSSTKGLVRAVGSLNAVSGKVFKQSGVIIDGLGDINSTIAVNFSNNPMVFLSDNIVDNRVRVPTIVKMTVLVSNYNSDNLLGTVENIVDNWDPTGLASLTYEQFLKNNGNTRAQEKLYQLRGLMETGVPFTLYTPHGLYENMLIKSLKPRTDAEKMDMLYCDVEFQEVLMYTDYSTNPGKIPARRDVSYVGSGWTQTAVKKAEELGSGK